MVRRKEKPSSGLVFLIVVLVAAVAVGVGVKFKISSLASISQYQGIHPQFAGVYYDGKMYTSSETYDASVCRIHPGSLDFDPDKETWYKPNIQGELRDIQIIQDLSRYEVGDAYTHILNLGGELEEPGAYKVYTWDVEKEGVLHQYRMELWLCSLQVNLWALPDEGGLLKWPDGEQMNQKYSSTEVWLKLEIGPSWYFEGADEAYFGLAYMELAEFSQHEAHEDPNVEVIPESKWAAFSIYDSLGGVQEDVENPLSAAYTYQGALLNPNVFKTTWYTNIHLGDFGSFDYNVVGGGFDTHSVQFRVLVHCFVVGEWKVLPTAGVERDMPAHQSTTQENWWDPFLKWLASPVTGFFGLVFGALILLALLWFFAPTLFGYLAGKARSSMKSLKKKG